MQSGVLRDLKSSTRHGSEKPRWSRSLEGLGTLVRLGLEGLLLFVYPNLLSNDRFTAWRVVERFFAEVFDFLFNNTSRCYLVFAFSLPLLLCFTFIICCSCLCIRVVIGLLHFIYSCSTLR